MHWFDDVVFEEYQTWDDAVEDRCNFFGVKAGKNTSLKIYEYFGGDGDIGARAYSRGVKYGIGREILSNMLPSEKSEDIKQALTALPLTARAKRGMELQAEESFYLKKVWGGLVSEPITLNKTSTFRYIFT